jgi:hypothetical protein
VTKSAVVSSGGVVETVVACPRVVKKCTGHLALQASTAVTARASAREAKANKGTVLELAAGSFKISGGQAATIKLRLTAKARKILTGVHVIHARATLVVRDPKMHTTHATVTIRAAKETHSKKS